MTIQQKALRKHHILRGKIRVESAYKVRKLSDLDWLYTPGVAAASLAIARRRERVFDLTSKWNNVGIVTDGSRVLGLGNIGAEAAIPVMEGKALLFKLYGGVNAWPVCIRSQDRDDIVRVVQNLEPMFGGINLEDIETPKCFEIEATLKKSLSIPVFHDDQHGTAIVVLAALINALKIVKKDSKKVRIVFVGAGAAGIGVSRLLFAAGIKNVVMVDTRGIIFNGRSHVDMYKSEIVHGSHAKPKAGGLKEALVGADVVIGLSGKKDVMSAENVRTMGRDPIVFALTNPDPDIHPHDAKRGGAVVVATGRSDFPNQVNNALVFPGIFRGALDRRVREITRPMMVKAAQAVADFIPRGKVRPDYVIPRVTERGVMKKVAAVIR